MSLFYFIYNRLYQWSAKGNGSTPLFTTVVWLAVTLFLNVVTVCSLITICTGNDIALALSIPKSRYAGVAYLSVWGLLLWLGLRIFHVHEKAFSEEMKKKYEKSGYRGSWVITYLVVSYIAMGFSAWFAGKRLGLH